MKKLVKHLSFGVLAVVSFLILRIFDSHLANALASPASLYEGEMAEMILPFSSSLHYAVYGLLFLIFILVYKPKSRTSFKAKPKLNVITMVGGSDGAPLKSWTCELPGATIRVDLESEVVTLDVKKATLKDYSKDDINPEAREGHYHGTFPFSIFSIECKPEYKAHHNDTSTTASGYLGGRLIEMRTPSSGPTTYEDTGRMHLIFRAHDKTPKDGIVSPTRQSLVISMKNLVDKRYKSDLDMRAVKDEIARKGELLRSAKWDKNQEALALVEAAVKSESERIAALARENADCLSSEHELRGDFRTYEFDRNTGDLASAIVVDKDGRSLISVGDDLWVGSLINASASIVNVENSGEKALQIQVLDLAYETSTLKRRRFLLMKGGSDGKLLDWSDRINVSAERLATPTT
jgi:hypothetical protein